DLDQVDLVPGQQRQQQLIRTIASYRFLPHDALSPGVLQAGKRVVGSNEKGLKAGAVRERHVHRDDVLQVAYVAQQVVKGGTCRFQTNDFAGAGERRELHRVHTDVRTDVEDHTLRTNVLRTLRNRIGFEAPDGQKLHADIRGRVETNPVIADPPRHPQSE